MLAKTARVVHIRRQYCKLNNQYRNVKLLCSRGQCKNKNIGF